MLEIVSQGSLQGDVCIADSDLLSDGATTVCVELKNQLSEELEVFLELKLGVFLSLSLLGTYSYWFFTSFFFNDFKYHHVSQAL